MMDLRAEIELKKKLYPEWGAKLDAADKRIMLSFWQALKDWDKERTK